MWNAVRLETKDVAVASGGRAGFGFGGAFLASTAPHVVFRGQRGETFRFGRVQVQGKLVLSPCGRRRLTNEKKIIYKHFHRKLVFVQPISHVATFRASDNPSLTCQMT